MVQAETLPSVSSDLYVSTMAYAFTHVSMLSGCFKHCDPNIFTCTVGVGLHSGLTTVGPIYLLLIVSSQTTVCL